MTVTPSKRNPKGRIPCPSSPKLAAAKEGFSLLEILVAVSILAMLLLLTTSILNHTGNVWRSTTALTSAFREGRSAFESITRRLSQATLNPYFDFVDATGQNSAAAGPNFVPQRFERQSELHFVSGQASRLLSDVPSPAGSYRNGHGMFFQAPLGFSDQPPTGSAQLVNLLNATGYFVQYGDDSSWRPSFLTGRNVPLKSRYRLMQMMQGTESLRIYSQALTETNRLEWIRQSLRDSPALARPVAENMILTVFMPLDPGGAQTRLTADYEYDSKAYLSENPVSKQFQNQLPPAVGVTMIAIDEVSAIRLEALYPGGTFPQLQPGTSFTDTASYEDDLANLKTALSDAKLNFRVFSTNVVIRQSKFSKNP